MGFFDKIFRRIGDIFKGIGDFIGGIFKGIINFIGGIFGVPKIGVPDVNTSVAADGVIIQKTGTNEDIPVIYGYRQVGGKIIFAETTGDNNQYLYVVYVLSEGEIQGIEEIIVDNHSIVADFPFNSVYSVTTGRYAGRMQWQFFAGTENQSQSSLANESSSWSRKTRRLPGIAYAVGRFEWKKATQQELKDQVNSQPYNGGIPQVRFNVLGKKVYNVINHTGGQDLSTTYANLPKTFSYNPVNQLLDYLLNPRYGCDLNINQIDADTFKTMAIKCNQQVTYDVNSTQAGKAITSSVVLSTKQKLFENVKLMLSGTRAFMPYTQGRFKLNIEDGGNPTDITSSTVTSVIDIDEDDIIGDFNLAGEQKSTKYNQVIVNYVDPDQDFTEQAVIYTQPTTSGSVSEVIADINNVNDNPDLQTDNEDLIGEFTFNTIFNKHQAQDVARMLYHKSRFQRTITFTGSAELLELEPGDIFRVTSETLGLNLTTFRVLTTTVESDIQISITAREHKAEIYPYVQGLTVVIPPQPILPDEYILTPPSRPKRENPIGVVPPGDVEPPIQDPEQDSLGLPIFGPVPPPNPPTPPPEETLTITTFESAKQGNELSGLTQTETAVVCTDNRGPNELDFSGSYNQTRGIIDFRFSYNPPQDTSIDQIRIFAVDRTTGRINDESRKPIDSSRRGRRYQRLLERIPPNSVVYVRFVNTDSNREYLDGSDGGLPTVSYINENGQTVTDNDLSAYLNYFIQQITVPSTTGATSGTASIQ